MSGLSRTPGKRVQGNTLTGVRIPPSPPEFKNWRVSLVARSITLPDGKLMLQNLGGNNMLPWPGKEKSQIICDLAFFYPKTVLGSLIARAFAYRSASFGVLRHIHGGVGLDSCHRPALSLRACSWAWLYRSRSAGSCSFE